MNGIFLGILVFISLELVRLNEYLKDIKEFIEKE